MRKKKRPEPVRCKPSFTIYHSAAMPVRVEEYCGGDICIKQGNDTVFMSFAMFHSLVTEASNTWGI